MYISVFPERVGRVVLDGVMNPNYYSQGRPDMGWASDVESTDETFQGFASGCETAGPEGCLLTIDNEGMGVISWAQNLTEVCIVATCTIPSTHTCTVGL